MVVSSLGAIENTMLAPACACRHVSFFLVSMVKSASGMCFAVATRYPFSFSPRVKTSTVAVLPDCLLPTTDTIGMGRVMFSIHLHYAVF
jgi:hypothetical protein